MNREAVLLYLETIIDLEIAKEMLPKAAQKEQDNIEHEKDVIRREYNNIVKKPPKYYEKRVYLPGEEPTFSFSLSKGAGLSIVVGIVFMIMALIFFIKPLTAGYIPVDSSNRLLVDFLSGLCFVFFAFFVFIKPIKEYKWQKKAFEMKWDAWKSRSSIENIEQLNSEIEKERQRGEEIRKQNKIILQKRKNEIQKLQNHQKQRQAYYQSELNRLDSIIRDFWNMNIIPYKYRNLPSIIWIYRWMSSCQDSLEATLIHAHMEEGIQRIEKKMNQIIYSLEKSLEETRILNEKTSYIISQNQNMLSSLERTEQNTSIAAEYAQLSANYNKANAYFSLATYLNTIR